VNSKLEHQGYVYLDLDQLPEYDQKTPPLMRRDEVTQQCGYAEGQGYVWLRVKSSRTGLERMVHVPVDEMVDRVVSMIMAYGREDGSADPVIMDRTIYWMHLLFDACVAGRQDVGRPLSQKQKRAAEFAMRVIEKRWRSNLGGDMLKGVM